MAAHYITGFFIKIRDLHFLLGDGISPRSGMPLLIPKGHEGQAGSRFEEKTLKIKSGNPFPNAFEPIGGLAYTKTPGHG
jgi:hypothetical protein